MGPTSWELQDPVVSFLAFIPGFRVFRFELQQHWNVLWSNLVNMGVPLLGNEVQSAPLFPLTLLFFWIPQKLYWNFLVVTRVVLGGAAASLIALKLFKFSRVQAFVFMICLAYAMHVMRWMNHPWQNGFFASLWYLYFLASDLNDSEPGPMAVKKRVGLIVGQALSLYSIITCGFPEATALGGVLAGLFMLPLFIAKIAKKEPGVKRFFEDLFFSHFIGFSFAAAQVFALKEYVGQSASDFRLNIGTYQYESFMHFWYMLFRTEHSPPGGPIIHIFNLIPIFLFFCGLYQLIVNWKKINRFSVAALLMGLFYILKCFKIWPAFNTFIGSLPILESTWFTVYFLPLLLWPFAYFAAKGAAFLLTSFSSSFPLDGMPEKKKTSIGHLISVMLILLIIGILSKRALSHSPQWDRLIFFKAILPLLVLVALLWRELKRPTPFLKVGLPIVFCLLLLVEANVTFKTNFLKFSTSTYHDIFFDKTLVPELKKTDQFREGDLVNMRERSGLGDFVSEGIATIDNGASALITERSRVIRTRLFSSPWWGYMPIEKPISPVAWQLVSAGLMILTLDEYKNKKMEDDPGWVLIGKSPLRAIMRDKKALHRAYMASECLPAVSLHNSMDQLLTFKEADLGKAIVENLDDSEKKFCSTLKQKTKNLNIVKDAGTLISLESVQGPGLLILNDSYYPGWKARDKVSGEEFSIRPVNVNSRGLFLKENKPYEVIYTYEPSWLWIVKALLGGGAIALFFLAYAYKRAKE